ncbi:transcriptional regulator [Microbulbifer okhotskensis]|uniref:transcriptional regulator n=1 Tax=Microbulbifer okhotskensis TaxID=2926617 RepID=UPI00359C59FD
MKTNKAHKDVNLEALKRAVAIVGTKSGLAKSIGVKPPVITQWFKSKRPIPAGQCRPIEAATNGAVTRYELRPDIYGDPVHPDENFQPAESVNENSEGGVGQ